MSNVKKSTFRFVGIKILRSELNFSSITPNDLAVEISPKGTYQRLSKVYTLNLEVKIKDSLGSLIASVVSESQFLFEEEIGDSIPKYFTLNAPALTFPYIRAYISSLSSLSGLGALNLPLLNLVDLAKTLEKDLQITD